MKKNTEKSYFGCPTEAALDAIGGKWKGMILYHLSHGTKRFSELQRLIPAVSQRMLTAQLRQLEADQIIHREVYPEVPPKVEYSLTDFGQALEPVLRSLQNWGVAYLEKLDEIKK